MAHLTRTGPSGSKPFPQPTLPAWTPPLLEIPGHRKHLQTLRMGLFW